uniref:Reverse transcriptase domain-containing protein n=1 Tax=Oryzias latipes TaxID=8090 RepID=A0A3P9L8G6_ORYLA
MPLLTFFRSKVINIRSSKPDPASLCFSVPDSLSESSPPFLSFTVVSKTHIEKTLRGLSSSTCTLDPLLTALVKSVLPTVSPTITELVNISLQTGYIPPSLKTAVIRPTLKKPSLDAEVLANYRPISNLPFLSKVLEKIVASQLQNHLKQNNHFEKFQSGFRSAHSTETALLRVTNDLLMAADSGSPSLLVLLDLTAAFDPVDHTVQNTVGLSADVLQWFPSYLTDRTEYVLMGGCRWSTLLVTCGVPQGSVLGPILFIIDMLPLGRVISKHGLSFHCYADDTQIYIKTAPNSPAAPSHLTACLEEMKAWMNSNFLQLNSSKTEALVVGPPADKFLLNIPVHFRQSDHHRFLLSHQPRSTVRPSAKL